MKIRRLKNGKDALEASVETTMLHLEDLEKEDPIALYELREKSRDPGHQFFPGAEQKLIDRALILTNGEVLGPVKDVVESAVTGEMLKMRLQSPYAEDDSPPSPDKPHRK